MDIFSVITLFGGVALFLYGMSAMSKGLEKATGGKLEVMLQKMTENKGKGFLLGMIVTVLVQSSSAITVMLMGLVNSGIMEIGNTVAVIMGSNVGTTITAWILSVMGLDSTNIAVRMLKPESFSPILAVIGMIMIMMCKSDRKKTIGEIMVGFAVLMFGMTTMSGAVAPLADSPEFTSIITAFKNPFIGVLTGTILTAAIQSSAASVCILQTLSLTGEITMGMAIPIVMGQNIGTCITAVISGVGVNKNAKRVALIHVLFNVIGTVIFMSIYSVIYYGFDLAFVNKSISPVGIALAHSVFNVGTTIILFPLSNKIVGLTKKIIKIEGEKEEVFLDERLLLTPSIALQECRNLSVEMAMTTRESMYLAMNMLGNYNQETADKVIKMEDDVDRYEDRLGSYLIKLSACDIKDSDRAQVSKLLHSIGDFERISDHAVNIVDVSREMYCKDCMFSEDGRRELRNVTNAIKEILDLSIQSFASDDVETAYKVEPLEEIVDNLIESTKVHHIQRLQEGRCTIQYGFIMGDLLNDYERVSDHCSNVALGIIELYEHAFKPHEYVNELMAHDDPTFRKYFNAYRDKYNMK